MHAAHHRRGDVVRVSFDGRRHLQQVVGCVVLGAEGVGRNQPSGDGRRAAAHAAGQRNGVVTPDADNRHLLPGIVEQKFHGPVDQIVPPGGQFAGALAGDLNHRLSAVPFGADNLHLKGVPDV